MLTAMFGRKINMSPEHKQERRHQCLEEREI